MILCNYQVKFNKEKRLNKRLAEYWKNYFDKNIMYGLELELEIDNVSEDEARDELQNIFECSDEENCTYLDNDYLIYGVDLDGSLNNGVEIKVLGRRFYPRILTKHLQGIFNILKNLNYYYYINERCSMHVHMLIQPNSLETKIPKVIFNNFYKLIRYFAAELTWITANVKDKSSIHAINEHQTLKERLDTVRYFTRYNNYCKANKEAGLDSLKIYGEKYKLFNVMPMINNLDKLNDFHIEIRLADGQTSPIVIVSYLNILHALLLKACELSQFGEVYRIDDIEVNYFYKKIRNEVFHEETGIRASEKPSYDIIEIIRNNALTLIDYLFKYYDNKTVYKTLLYLATIPQSLRTHEELKKLNEYEKEMLYEYEDIVDVAIEILNDYNIKVKDYNELEQKLNEILKEKLVAYELDNVKLDILVQDVIQRSTLYTLGNNLYFSI